MLYLGKLWPAIQGIIYSQEFVFALIGPPCITVEQQELAGLRSRFVIHKTLNHMAQAPHQLVHVLSLFIPQPFQISGHTLVVGHAPFDLFTEIVLEYLSELLGGNAATTRPARQGHSVYCPPGLPGEGTQ